VELVELDDAARRVLARRHPQVAQHEAVVAIGITDAIRPAVLRAIEQVVTAANQGQQLQTEALVGALLEPDDPPSPQAMAEAGRQAVLRARLLQDFGAYSSEELATLVGSEATNRAQVAHRWSKEGRIFGVPHRGRTVFLGFQFDEGGQPLAVIAPVLAALEGWAGWDVAGWFVFRNALLGQRRPVDLLGAEPDAVVGAARQAGQMTGALSV
jgi:hypothetical protein